MESINITIIQTNLVWENIPENLKSFSEKIDAIKEPTDLIILPEMFTTGFSMNPTKLSEEMNGSTISWLKEKSNQKNCVITGSFICKENNYYYNRLVWMNPDGTHKTYDKRHLFSMAEENKHFTAGKDKLIVELKGWKICPLICYDLRFPVWSRNKVLDKNNIPLPTHNSSLPPSQTHKLSHKGELMCDYDLLIYVANWPEKRSHAWKTLLIARAIENQSYVIGLNRIGKDGNNIDYSGDSMMIDFKGEIFSKTKPHEKSIETIELNYSDLKEFRTQIPNLMDADNFTINL